MSSRHHVVVAPDTRRMVEGLRDTGYTFNAAIADLIDNSIAANASRVSVYLGWTSDREIIVTVADDGYGMSESGLQSAMRYGAPERPSRSNLGRFGLGLKTASTGFCRRLTVMSRDAADAPVSAAVWDLDDLVKAGEWTLDLGAADETEISLWQDSLDELVGMSGEEVSSGTVVLWQKVDKLLKTKSGTPARNLDLALRKTEEKLSEHLAMVFQRFLDTSDDRARNVSIAVNGTPVRFWDPFLENRGGALALEKRLTMRPAYAGSDEDERFDVVLRAFILPRKDEFPTDEARNEAKISIDRQGIYLYREDRMIEGPDWLGTGATETHLNTLRVELSFPGQLDEVLGVGIKKSGVHIDSHLIEVLRELLTPVRREADRLSRKGRVPSVATSGGGASRPTERTIARLKGNLTVAKVESGANGAISLVNNSGEVVLRDGSGKDSGIVTIAVSEGDASLNVVRDETLDDGALWEARLAQSNIQVAINAGHAWYRRAYLPYSGDSNLVQAIEYLFYALAQAEMNNTDADAHETFEEFRIEVSRNLKKLVRDLPEPDND